MFRGLNSLSRKLVLPAVLVALVGVSDAYAAGPGLYGHVLGQGEDGDLQGVIPNAEVQFLRGNAVVAEATTNASGYYKVNLAPGPYTYRVRASGYKSDDAGRRMRLQRSTGYVVREFILVKGQDPPDRVKPNPVEVHHATRERRTQSRDDRFQQTAGSTPAGALRNRAVAR